MRRSRRRRRGEEVMLEKNAIRALEVTGVWIGRLTIIHVYPAEIAL